MPAPWTKEEKEKYKAELLDLYVKQNLSIKEIGQKLGIAESSVYDRLRRLKIPTCPERKKNYLNKRSDVKIPNKYSRELAEFFGIMLGDGGITHFQVSVHLGTKENNYAKYIVGLYKKLFNVSAQMCIRKTKHKDLYLGSTKLSKWLLSEGLVFNKVKEQVDIPEWIFSKKVYMKRFARGFFDTDGSVYLLKFGIQLSFVNYSKPLLRSLRKLLIELEYNPSRISINVFYLTKRSDVRRFFKEISPANVKHVKRYRSFEKKR